VGIGTGLSKKAKKRIKINENELRSPLNLKGINDGIKITQQSLRQS